MPADVSQEPLRCLRMTPRSLSDACRCLPGVSQEASSQDSTARNLWPGVHSRESTARSHSQESTARSPQPGGHSQESTQQGGHGLESIASLMSPRCSVLQRERVSVLNREHVSDLNREHVSVLNREHLSVLNGEHVSGRKTKDWMVIRAKKYPTKYFWGDE